MAKITPERAIAELVLARSPDVYRTLLRGISGGTAPKELIPVLVKFWEDLVALDLVKQQPRQPSASPPRALFEDDQPEPRPPRRRREETPSAFTIPVADSSAPFAVPAEWIEEWRRGFGERVDVEEQLRMAEQYWLANAGKRRTGRRMRAVLTNWMITAVEIAGRKARETVAAIPPAAAFESPACCPWLAEWWAYHLARFPEHGTWLDRQPHARSIWTTWGDAMGGASLAIAKRCTDDLAAGRLKEDGRFPGAGTRGVWTEARRRGAEAAAKLKRAREAQAAATREPEPVPADFSMAAEYRKRLREGRSR